MFHVLNKLGSLNKASNELNMSHSKAWKIVNRAETLLGYSLLMTNTGGVNGGGSVLTPKAKKLIRSYKGLCKEAGKDLEETYEKYFKGV